MLQLVLRLATKPVDDNMLVTVVVVVTPTDRPRSVRYCCVIKVVCGDSVVLLSFASRDRNVCVRPK